MARNNTSIANPVLVGKPQPIHTNPIRPRVNNPYQSPNPTDYLPSQPLPTPVTGDYNAGSNPYSDLIGVRPPFPIRNATDNTGAGASGNASTGGASTPTSPTSPTNPSTPSSGGTGGSGIGNANTGGTGAGGYGTGYTGGTGYVPSNGGIGSSQITNDPYSWVYTQPIAPDTTGYYNQLIGYDRDEYTAQAQQILDAQRKANIAAYNAYLEAINPYGMNQERLAQGGQVNSGVRDYVRTKAYRNMRNNIVNANDAANQSYLDLILAYQQQIKAEQEAGLI